MPRFVNAWTRYRWVLVLILLLGAARGTSDGHAAAPTAARPAVHAQLEKLMAAVPAATEVGLVVADAATGELWYAHLPDTPLKPASVMKLFTTAAALHRFGHTFSYQTRAYLRGDELWVAGAGDPSLGDERVARRLEQPRDHLLDTWADALKRRGQTRLARIVLDDTVFEPSARHPEWPDDQADRYYQAPVGGLNYNDNCLDVRVAVRDGRTIVHTDPALPDRFIRASVRVGGKQRPITRRPPDSSVFEVAGTVRADTTLSPVSALDATEFFGAALAEGLRRRGIAITGDVRRGRLPQDLPSGALLATHATSLRDVLWRCNRFSQNLFAECLFKTLAAYGPDGRRARTRGSWDAGRAVLQRTLLDLGVDPAAGRFRDGSGLSHTNRVTAGQVARLLVQMRKHPHADVFLSSLAEPGESGTMRRRYNKAPLRGRLHGKTGTIAGVRALAGYLERPDGDVLAFALLINGRASRSLPTDVCLALLAAP